MGRFFATYGMNVGFQYTVELMPTCLRGQGIALVNMMSMVSLMAGPYIVYSVRVWRIRSQSIWSEWEAFPTTNLWLNCTKCNWNSSVCHIREGPLPHHRYSLRPWSCPRSILTWDCGSKNARHSGGHQGVREVKFEAFRSGNKHLLWLFRRDRLFWMPLCKGRRRFKKRSEDNFDPVSSVQENKGFRNIDEVRL